MVFRQGSRGNISFIVGVSLGIAVSLLVTSFSTVTRFTWHRPAGLKLTSQQRRLLPLQNSPDLHDPSLHEVHGDAEGDENARVVNFEDVHVHHDDDSIAREMASRIPVLVWVMTSPENLDKKAIHVRNTWGKRANKLLFMSSQWNSTFPTIGLNVSEGREHLTGKTMQAFHYIYEHHFGEADWFMKADDDTYVIMENLRYMLSSYSSEDPIYFGHIFKVIVKQGYASGGAGYVISKEALRRLGTKGMNRTLCRQDGGAEDAEVGKCLMNLGVKLMPSVDRLGRSRFHCFDPELHLQGGYPDWYKQYDVNGAKKGIESISDYPITFHYISAKKMYEMEYYVYHLRPFGILSRSQSLNLETKGTGT